MNENQCALPTTQLRTDGGPSGTGCMLMVLIALLMIGVAVVLATMLT